jgi:hypothetical protein
METQTTEKTEYEAPHVVDFGDLVSLTAGGSDGCDLDSNFPVGTPKRNLTFSGTNC